MQGLVAPTLPGLVVKHATGQAADRPAVVDDAGGSLTYRELAQRSTNFSKGLQGLGVRPGDVVGLLAPNSVDWVASMLGSQMAGATVAAYHTWVKAHELDFLLRHSEAKVLIVAPNVGEHDLLAPLLELLPQLGSRGRGEWASSVYPRLKAVVVLGDGRSLPIGTIRIVDLISSGGTGGEPLIDPDPAQAAVVLYTSGSTADPKGVPLLHGDMAENGFQIGERMRLRPDDKVWLGSPLFWSFGSANALSATLTHAATLVMQHKFSAPLAAQQIRNQSCTVTYLLPAMAYALVDLPDVRSLFSTVRTGLTIGRREEIEMVVTRLGIDGICNIYGSTETYGNCCVTPCDAPLELRLRSQGPPLPGFELRVVDESSGRELEAGETGSVYVRGRITPGYLKAADLNRETFTPDGWYRSGDTGFLDANGYFTFVTRETDMIKTNGINVSPAEVEEFIATDPNVAEVVVVGAPDPLKDQVIVAFVKPTPGCSVIPEDVIRRCREKLAAYKAPQSVHVVEEIPLTATGKLSRKLLLQLLPGRRPAAAG